MSFIAYTFLNYLRNASEMQYSQIVRTLDKMQMSEIKEDGEEELLYLRSNIDENQRKLQKTLTWTSHNQTGIFVSLQNGNTYNKHTGD